jgi:hypothetical protein
MILSSEREGTAVALTESGYHIGDFIGQREVLNCIELREGVTYVWVHSSLAQSESGVCRTVVSHQEQTRLYVHGAFFDQ